METTQTKEYTYPTRKTVEITILKEFVWNKDSREELIKNFFAEDFSYYITTSNRNHQVFSELLRRARVGAGRPARQKPNLMRVG